ncbi:hypothetical protein, partial [Aeromonas veronii]|uniref:hypothetical protein n=1 Tax=Aeromonas veronii TaxID=654 RepID=UPI0019D63580
MLREGYCLLRFEWFNNREQFILKVSGRIFLLSASYFPPMRPSAIDTLLIVLDGVVSQINHQAATATAT